MNTLATALMWRSLGIATIPILYRSKLPALDLWKPYQQRLPSEFELRAWFGRSGYNLAVITGWQGLVIVDWDDREKLKEWRVNTKVGRNLGTYQVSTPRGVHLYLYCHEITQCVKLDGADIKAGGGYCLAPPSVHPSGVPYYSNGLPTADIRYVSSMARIFPEYQQAISKPVPRPPASTLDVLDAAWLPHTSTTIEEANAKLDWGQLLGPTRIYKPLSGGHRHHYHCPFHEDRNPSLFVYPDGHWYCFGCNIGGRDKLDLYARLNGMTIKEALCTL